MKQWIKENWRTVLAVLLTLAAYGLSKVDGLEAEKELLEYLFLAVGLGGIGFVPKFTKPNKEEPK